MREVIWLIYRVQKDKKRKYKSFGRGSKTEDYTVRCFTTIPEEMRKSLYRKWFSQDEYYMVSLRINY